MSDEKNSRDHGIAQYHDLPEGEEATAELKRVYANWAQAYDHDNDHKLGTVSQPNSVAALARHLPDKAAPILDVGCGTGIVGDHLRKQGYTTYDGTDLSPEMLAIANSRGYRKLVEADAAHGLPFKANTYDATLCVGVFTHGHLQTDAFSELLRITRQEGIIIFTVNEGVWQSGGFEPEIIRLEQAGMWTILEKDKKPYMVAEKVDAYYVVARKNFDR